MNWIDSGKIPGPKIHVTGPYLEGQGEGDSSGLIATC
jgi:hypothetical protein